MLIGHYDNTEVLLKARFGHTFAIGATGSGKSTLLHNCAVQDIWAGNGVCVIDPLGQTIDDLLDCIPLERIQDVVLFDPSDLQYPVGLNLVGRTPKDERHVATERVVSALHKYFGESWGIRLEAIIRHALRLHLDMNGVSVLSIYKMLVSKKHRNEIIALAKDPINEFFWQNDFDKWTPTEQREAIRPVLNRLEQLLLNPALRNIFGQIKTTISLKECMEQRKILLIRLPKGQLGEDPVNLLGSLLVAEIEHEGLARAETFKALRAQGIKPETVVPPFYFYIEEAHNFTTSSFINMFSELRKYFIGITLIEQFTRNETLTKAILGNVHNLIVFRVGPEDAELLYKRLPKFDPPITPHDLVTMGNHRAFVDFADVPEAIDMYDRDVTFETGSAQAVIKESRERYGTPRDKVEETISRFLRKGRKKTRGL